MEITYGDGFYLGEGKNIEGRIVLSEHKLFLKNQQGEDLTSTYIPLEKIEKVKKVSKGIEVYVRPGIVMRYSARIVGKKDSINELLKELISRRGLKKRFLSSQWIEDSP